MFLIISQIGMVAVSKFTWVHTSCWDTAWLPGEYPALHQAVFRHLHGRVPKPRTRSERSMECRPSPWWFPFPYMDLGKLYRPHYARTLESLVHHGNHPLNLAFIQVSELLSFTQMDDKWRVPPQNRQFDIGPIGQVKVKLNARKKRFQWSRPVWPVPKGWQSTKQFNILNCSFWSICMI